MARNCSSTLAIMASFMKEVADLFIGVMFEQQEFLNSAFQPSDFRDNATGRKGANGDCPHESCDEHCRANGITPETPEGPGNPDRPYGPFGDQ